VIFFNRHYIVNNITPPRIEEREGDAGAVSYYFDGHNFKLQGDYTNIHTQLAGKQATDDPQQRVQAPLVF